MTLKQKLYNIIFEADTKTGKYFDLFLLFLILLSVITVMIESVVSFNHILAFELKVIEWVITIVFTLEYILRILIVQKPLKYIFSFYGIIDFLSILPTFLGFFIPGSHGLMTIRALRLFRVFRILKLNRYTSEGNIIFSALKASRRKISVFLYFIILLVIVFGTLIYLVEGEENGFSNIPKSIYWAIVTLTTVGYGDITPQTFLGQFISSIIMIIGYAVIAVPTGIVTAEFTKFKSAKYSTQVCPNCLKEGHIIEAEYCYNCGRKLNEDR